MIITVTLNAAIDKTLAVPNFRLGRRHRAVEQTAMAGGKGVNVARALKALGQPVIATGVAGGPTGTRIIEQLTDEAILNDFVRIREESRTSTAVVDPTSGEQTEINERGPSVSTEASSSCSSTSCSTWPRAPPCACSPAACRAAWTRPLRAAGRGAAPAGRDHRARLARASRCGSATRAGPDVVTPERARGRGAGGPRVRRRARTAARAVAEMVELGAREAVMTLPDGCLALLGDEADATQPARVYRATLDPLEPVSSVGSGDAFLAGFVAARYGGRAAEDCLRFAVACGAESTQHFGAGVLDPREVERLPSEVELEELAPERRAGRRLIRRDAAGGPRGCRCYGVQISSAAEPRMPPWK